MAIDSVKFGSQQILIGNRETPTTFTAPLQLTTLGFNPNISLVDTPIPEVDVDQTAYIESEVTSNQVRVTGNGVVASEWIGEWDTWWFAENGLARPCRWKRNLGSPAAGLFEGQAVLASYSESGEKNGRWTVDIEIAFSGRPIWTPLPAA